MPSFRSSAFLVAAAFVAVGQCDYDIDPESVPLSTREQWCSSEKSTCPIICQQVEPRTTLVNECDPESLTYGCLCGNNKRPNITEFTLTLPYFICQEWGNQCVDGCNGNNACISSCREDNPCGASDPTQVNATETSTGTTKPTASSTDDEDDEDAIFTGTPGSKDDDDEDADTDAAKNKDDSDDDEDTPRTNEPGAASGLALGKAYGLAVVMGGLFMGFALL